MLGRKPNAASATANGYFSGVGIYKLFRNSKKNVAFANVGAKTLLLPLLRRCFCQCWDENQKRCKPKRCFCQCWGENQNAAFAIANGYFSGVGIYKLFRN
jgi:hypothetical protein